MYYKRKYFFVGRKYYLKWSYCLVVWFYLWWCNHCYPGLAFQIPCEPQLLPEKESHWLNTPLKLQGRGQKDTEVKKLWAKSALVLKFMFFFMAGRTKDKTRNQAFLKLPAHHTYLDWTAYDRPKPCELLVVHSVIAILAVHLFMLLVCFGNCLKPHLWVKGSVIIVS